MFLTSTLHLVLKSLIYSIIVYLHTSTTRNIHIFIELNYALIESHLRYADVIWSNLSKTKLAALQHLQDLAYSIISNARIKDSWSTSWLNVENLFCYDRNVLTHKIMNRLYPESLWDKFQPRSFHSTYNTRHCKDLQIPRYRTEFVKKGFHYAAVTLWNDTPAEIRDLPTSF